MEFTGGFREVMKHEIFEIGKNMNVGTGLPKHLNGIDKAGSNEFIVGWQNRVQHANKLAMGW